MQKGLRLRSLSGFNGFSNYEENNRVPESKIYDGRNVRFTSYKISSKNGYEALGNELTGGTKFRGLFEYPYFNNGVTDKRLIGYYDKVFHQYNEATTTWDSIATTWADSADEDVEGGVYNNVLYIINPMDAANDGIGKIEDGTFSVVANSPRGNALEFWVERMWTIGDKDAPNAVLASRAAIVAHPEYIEDFNTDPVLELVGKGGSLRAIRVLNNELFLWKEDSIWYNTTDRFAAGEQSFVELSRTGGAVNQKSTVVVENDVWFLTPTNEIRSLGRERSLGDNPRTRELSSIIKRFMDQLDPDQSNAVASYNKRIYKLALKTKNSPTNNFVIVFDYDTFAFSVDIGQAIHKTCVWGGNLVYAGDADSGQVYLDDTGLTARNAAYTASFKTPFFDDGRPDASKRARYLYIRGKQSYDQELIIRLYRDASYTTYSEYTIESPRNRGVSENVSAEDGIFGAGEFGDAVFGGEDDAHDGVSMYRIQNSTEGDWLISVDRRSNMFAIGVTATINGGKFEIEQVGLKVIDDNENYKRSNQ